MRLSCRRKSVLLTRILLGLSFLPILFSASATVLGASDSYTPGARAVGFGYSGVVDIYDASALYWNPAALTVRHAPQGYISIHEPFTLNYMGYSHFTPRSGTFALAAASTWGQEHPKQSATVGWGYEFMPHFSAGFHVNAYELSGHTWTSFSVGFLFRPTRSIHRASSGRTVGQSPYIADRFTAGIVLFNIPLGQQQSQHQIRVGASYRLGKSGPKLIYAHHFSPVKDTDHLGLLFNPSSMVHVYAGLKNFDTRFFAFGGGFECDNIGLQLAYDALTERLVLSSTIRIGTHPKHIADQHYDQAIEALRQRDTKEALRHCEYSLIYDENHSRAFNLEKKLVPFIAKENMKIDSLLFAAQTFENQQNYLAAAAQYLKILKIDADNKAAQEAIAMIRPKVNIDVERWYRQAVQAYNDDDIERAKELFEAIILVRPDHFGSKNYLVKIQSYFAKLAEQHYFAGLGYYSQRKLDLAEAEFEKALSIDPNLEDASEYISRIRSERIQNRRQISTLLEEGRRLENNRMWNRALATYQEILEIQPDHAVALERRRDLESIISSTAESYYNQGKVAYDRGDRETALDMLNTTLRLDPSHTRARQLLNAISSSRHGLSREYIDRAKRSAAQQNWQNAIALADSVLALNPNHAEAQQIKADATSQLDVERLMQQARTHYYAGEYLEALELFETVLAKEPEHSEAKRLKERCQLELNAMVDDMFNRGIQLYTEEKYQEAINLWDTVLEINPYHKGARDYKEKAQEGLNILKNMP